MAASDDGSKTRPLMWPSGVRAIVGSRSAEISTPCSSLGSATKSRLASHDTTECEIPLPLCLNPWKISRLGSRRFGNWILEVSLAIRQSRESIVRTVNERPADRLARDSVDHGAANRSRMFEGFPVLGKRTWRNELAQ